MFSSGIRETGRASATDTTASKPETRITPLSTSTDCGSPTYSAIQTRLRGVPMGGAGAARRGGFTSLCESEHKTVGPSRVKKREIAGPPVNRGPDRN